MQSKYDTLRTMMEEERHLVQRLKVEEAQLFKRQIEEIRQELADAKKNAECATTRADLAEVLAVLLFLSFILREGNGMN